MKIIPTFTKQNEGIYTIVKSEDGVDELTRIVERLSDTEYLFNYFTINKHLNLSYYGDYTKNEAVLKTIEDAHTIFDQLYDMAEAGFTDLDVNLSQLFLPLHKNDVLQLKGFEPCKAYGLGIKNSWLRLYAIRLDVNTFIITGGGIKLVDAMQDDPLLTIELSKMNQTLQYLLDNNCIDVEDIITQ